MVDDLAYDSVGQWQARSSGSYVKFMAAQTRRPRRAGSGGNTSRQGAGEALKFRNFVTQMILRPNPNLYFATDFEGGFRTSVGPGKEIKTFITSKATLDEYLQWPTSSAPSSTTKGPADAISFIGHAISKPDVLPKTAVGIAFYDRDLIKAPPTSAGPYWFSRDPGRGPATAIWTPLVKTEAKVLFFSSCWPGADFESLWSLPSKGALILPLRPADVENLAAGAMAWVKISGLMVAGYTAGEAVHKWNTDEVADDEFRFRIAPSTNPLACLAKKCRPWTPPTP